MSNLRKADLILCASPSDQKVLSEEGLNSSRLRVWMPELIIGHNTKKTINKYLMDLKKNYFLVCFVGSNFEPNIIAVENIVKIARELSSSVLFLVIGDVDSAFKYRTDIPKNVIFTGFVENLDDYLAFCDAFINPKTTSDTGVETKMFDYIKFGKPIVSTPMGAKGFEKHKQVIIVRNLREIIHILKRLAGNKYQEVQ
jgi:glycosyltransferase involved in cell wall biosynthesis